MAVFLKRESAEKLLELAAKHGGTSQAIEWLINQYCMHQHMRSRRPRQDRTTKKSSSSELRKAIYQRDNFTCQYCGDPFHNVAEHVVPASKGGPTEPFNLVTACNSCNATKSNNVWKPNNLDLITAGHPEWRAKILAEAVPPRQSWHGYNQRAASNS